MSTASSRAARERAYEILVEEARQFLEQAEAEGLLVFDRLPFHLQVGIGLHGLEEAMIACDWQQVAVSLVLLDRACGQLRWNREEVAAGMPARSAWPRQWSATRQS
jgi:hypothetical protein